MADRHAAQDADATTERRGNPELDGWLESALHGFRALGGGSAEDFVSWLEGPDGPDAPALWDYAAGERTYVGYAMDPWVMACELGQGCTVDGVSQALPALHDGPAAITAERLVSLWSDEMNDMICNDPELVRGSLDLAIAGAGLKYEGAPLTSADELAKALTLLAEHDDHPHEWEREEY